MASNAPPGGAGAPAGRRILFIGLSYFSYTERIIAALREHAFHVDFYPAETRTFVAKTVRQFAPRLYQDSLRSYHDRILAQSAREHYDVVFFLQIHNISLEHVGALRKSQANARFILYNWDSLATHNYRPYLEHMDAVYTFDREDAARIGATYLPLFALPEYFAASTKALPAYDMYFVGAIVTRERFAAVRKLDAYCQAHGVRFAKHLHCSPAVLAMLLRHRLYMKGMTLRSVSTREIIALMNDSTAVFDFANHAQSGFTMRLVENLCAGKKIVTSNPRVRAQDFYTPEQFFVVESLNFTGLEAFLKGPRPDLNRVRPAIQAYSLDRWVARIFE